MCVECTKEIKSGEDYFAKISSLLDTSALVLIILDGLRPNVVFEFGYAMAKSKPVIIIRSKDSVLSIKTLYERSDHSGLTSSEWEKLKEPILYPPLHLSDFAGKHIPVIDRSAKETDDSHPLAILRKELTYQMSVILEEFQKIKKKDIDPNILNESLPHLIKIISLYNTDIEFEIEDLKTALEKIKKISDKHQQQLPDEVGNMVGSAFIRKGNLEVKKQNRDSAIVSFREALGVFDNLLTAPTLRNNVKLYGSVNDKSANIHLQLYGLEGERKHLRKAIHLFSVALSMNTKEDAPLDYGIIKSNIALAYHKLFLLENLLFNSIKSIVAFEEASKIYTLESYPLQYAGIHNNLGNVYMDLAAFCYQTDREKAIQYWQLAIKSYSESLKIFTESHPQMRAALLNTRATMYQNLAMVDINVKENSTLALKDINESLKIFTFKKYPDKYATGKYNEGVTYMKLYTIEPSEDTHQHSVTAFKDVANIFNKHSKEYYDSQFNLGNVYQDKIDYTVTDCKNDLESYLKSLEWYNDKPLSFEYAMT
jgi:hypothetical protein